MKARRITDTRGFNPAFNVKAFHAAARQGKEYPIAQLVTYPAGSIAEGSGVVLQCTLPQPTMVPADEECHAAVVAYLTHPARRDAMDRLKKMKVPEVFNQLPKGLQDYVRSINEKWQGTQSAAVSTGVIEFPPLDDTDEAPGEE